MKYISALLVVFSLLLVSCEGDPGPPGPPGPSIVSSAFEIIIDFNASNNYEFVEPYGFNVLSSDVTLVYILWENEDGTDIWRLCPQNVFFSEGILTYNFDFTQSDVRFFLDGTVNFDFLDNSWTQNQVFRVVVVPADNIDGLDTSDINNVLSIDQIKKLDLR